MPSGLTGAEWGLIISGTSVFTGVSGTMLRPLFSRVSAKRKAKQSEARDNLAVSATAAENLSTAAANLVDSMSKQIDDLHEQIKLDREDCDRRLRAVEERMHAGPLWELFAVVISDTTNNDGGIIVGVNPLACTLTGYRSEDLVGQSLDILVPEATHKAHHFYLQGYAAHAVPRPMGPDREVIVRHRDGHLIPVWIGLFPSDGLGHVTAVIMPRAILRPMVSTAAPVDLTGNRGVPPSTQGGTPSA